MRPAARLSCLQGARLGDLARLLAASPPSLAPPCLGRLAGALLSSAAVSALARLEPRLETSAPAPPPLFVLGHWRSGTTLLQYLLAEDPRLASPSTWEVCFPSLLVRGERLLAPRLAPLLPARRPQDRMRFGLSTPNEDEIAMAALGLPTPYLYYALPEAEERWLRYLTFREASAGERRAFCRGLDLYVRRLSAKHGRPLVLKSPPHTARVRLLTELYPAARFVFVHRHPFDVFRSTRHLLGVWRERSAFLQRPREGGDDERILRLYRELHDAYLEEAPLVPRGRLHVVRFEDLEREPLAEMARLYDALGLGPLPEARLAAFLGAERGYRKNRYAPLAAAERDRVLSEWGPYFAAFGYDGSRSVSLPA